MEDRSIEVHGLRIGYRYRDGPGPAVVLVPGGVLDSTRLTWKHVIRSLPPQYRVFAPDIPGYGNSERPDAPYTVEYYTDAVAHFMLRLELEQVHLFGNSMSGATAMAIALSRPELVRSLVLSGAYGFQDRFPLHELAYALIRLPKIDDVARSLLRLHPLLIRAVLPAAVWRWSRITDEMVADTWAEARNENSLTAFKHWMRSETLPHRVRTNFTDELHRLKMPVLLLHGRHDLMMPVQYTRRASTLLPDAEMHLFDSGHMAPRECFEEVLEAVTHFLARVDGRPGEPA